MSCWLSELTCFMQSGQLSGETEPLSGFQQQCVDSVSCFVHVVFVRRPPDCAGHRCICISFPQF